MNKNYVFQVNLSGMLELLSEHIYSNPGVFYRELLQNAVDAITARTKVDTDFEDGKIRVTLHKTASGIVELCFIDNGIGLTEQEAHTFLAVIGNSSKRGDQVAHDDYIGRFGIGLLSCLVVSDEITVTSRSLTGGHPIKWIGKADGTYKVEQIEENIPVGTSILLRPKKDWTHYFKPKTIEENCLYYGDALPHQIILEVADEKEKLLNKVSPVWLKENASKAELLLYGEKQFHTLFLDAFPLKTPSGLVEGTAFILPQKAQLTARKTQKVYIKRMLISESVDNLLPDWAFFLKCIINSNRLKPTASRESLVEDGLTQLARQEIGDEIKKYLYNLAKDDTERLIKLLKVHYMPLKAIASEDEELLELIIDYIPFETSRGNLTFKEIAKSDQIIYYTPSLDDYRQIRRIAGSKGLLVINAAYSYDEEIIRQISKKNPGIAIKSITPKEIMQEMSQLPVAEKQFFEGLLEKAETILLPHFCKIEIRKFSPSDTPVLYISDEESQAKKQSLALGKKATNPFSKTLNQLIQSEADSKEGWPVLCLNADNVLIKKLCTYTETDIIKPIIFILYTQALQLGQYPIQADEMKLLNESLTKILTYGLSEFQGVSGNPNLN